MLRHYLDGSPFPTPDGITPFFLESGAAPTAANAPYPPGSVLRNGTTYYLQVGTLAAPVWQAFNSLWQGQSLKELSISAFVDSLNLGFTDPYTIFDDELIAGSGGRWSLNNIGSGTAKRSTRSSIVLDSGAVSNDLGGTIFGANMGSSGFPLVFPNGAGSRFFARMRCKITATGLTAEINMGDAAEWLVGVRVASSATKFVARFSNGPTTLTSGVDIDTTAFHILDVYRDGATTTFRVDSEAGAPTSANGWATNEERLILRAFNNGTAAARSMIVDYVFFRGDRP
jgi:hypothetical protein